MDSGRGAAREIAERGYVGGLTTVKRFHAPHKPVPAPDAVVRFETEPGKQMQADFVVFRRSAPLSTFVATLGFRRASFVRFVTDERVDTVRRCLAEAFEFFGGVPAIQRDRIPRTVTLTAGLGFPPGCVITLPRDAYSAYSEVLNRSG